MERLDRLCLASAEEVAPLLRRRELSCVSLPCGHSPEGFLHSLQLVGRHGQEALLCRAGRAYERAADWHRLHPAL